MGLTSEGPGALAAWSAALHRVQGQRIEHWVQVKDTLMQAAPANPYMQMFISAVEECFRLGEGMQFLF
jgi:hypothetical protein